jgi:hypothetical protein
MTHMGMWRIYSNPDPHGVRTKTICLPIFDFGALKIIIKALDNKQTIKWGFLSTKSKAMKIIIYVVYFLYILY